MKKLLCIALVLVLTMSLAACGGGGNATTSSAASTAQPSAATPESNTQSAEKAKVAFICKGYTDTYTYLVMEIFKSYAEEKYADVFTVDYFDGQMNNDTINNLIESCTAEKYDVIIFQQNDPDTPVPVVKAATDAGIGVIVTVGSVNDNGESVYLDADPVQQGSLLVEYAISQGIVKKDTPVAVLRGMDGTFHSEGRTEGFVSLLNKEGANIVDNQTASWSTSEALPIVESWMISNPEIEVIFACNDDMALGALQAMEAANRMDIKVLSVDANELGCIELKNGRLFATVAQDTFGYAQTPADYAAALIRGEKVESKKLDSKLILIDDVDQILEMVHGYSKEEIAAVVK